MTQTRQSSSGLCPKSVKQWKIQYTQYVYWIYFLVNVNKPRFFVLLTNPKEKMSVQVNKYSVLWSNYVFSKYFKVLSVMCSKSVCLGGTIYNFKLRLSLEYDIPQSYIHYLHSVHYCNMGCQVFMGGIQNQTDFWQKINIPYSREL